MHLLSIVVYTLNTACTATMEASQSTSKLPTNYQSFFEAISSSLNVSKYQPRSQTASGRLNSDILILTLLLQYDNFFVASKQSYSTRFLSSTLPRILQSSFSDVVSVNIKNLLPMPDLVDLSVTINTDSSSALVSHYICSRITKIDVSDADASHDISNNGSRDCEQ